MCTATGLVPTYEVCGIECDDYGVGLYGTPTLVLTELVWYIKLPCFDYKENIIHMTTVYTIYVINPAMYIFFIENVLQNSKI